MQLICETQSREAQELALTEASLPAHLLYLMACEIYKKGWQLRGDMVMNLNAAAAAPLTAVKNDPMLVAMTAARVDSVAKTLLHSLAPDDPRDGLLACAYFTLKLVDERLLADPTNNAVPISLALVEDATEEGGDWPVREQGIKKDVGVLLTRARLMGLYCRAPI